MKNSKRLVAMLVALVLTIAMATTTTFAWFVIGNEVEVDAINVTVSAEGGLFISNAPDGVFKQYLALNESVSFDACTPVMLAESTTAFASKAYEKHATAAEYGQLEASAKALYEQNAALDAYLGLSGAYYTIDGTVGTPFTTEQQAIVNNFKYMQTMAGEIVVPNNVDFSNDTVARYYYDEFYFKSTEVKTVYLKAVTFGAPGTTNALTINTPAGLAEDLFGTDTNEAYAVDAQVEANVIDAIRVAVFEADGSLVGVYEFDQGTQDWADNANATNRNLAEELYFQHTNGNPAIMHNQTFTPSALPTEGASVGALTGSGTTWTGSCSVIVWLEGTDGHAINNLINQTVSIDFTFEGR